MKYFEYAELCQLAYKDNLDIINELISRGIRRNDIHVIEVFEHKCYIFKDNMKQYVVFRGTTNDKEIITDLDFWLEETDNGKVHGGFEKMANMLYNGIKEYLGLSCWIYFTGHSLGAAFSELISNKAFEEKYLVRASIEIAKPRTGDKEYAIYSASMPFKRIRISSNMDLVTKLPTTGMGFRHHSKHLFIDRNGKTFYNPSKLFIRWDNLLTWYNKRKITELGTDHFIKNYAKELKEAGV